LLPFQAVKAFVAIHENVRNPSHGFDDANKEVLGFDLHPGQQLDVACGKATAENRTPEQRSESASKAVEARWAKFTRPATS
jgi:hypothetical protein